MKGIFYIDRDSIFSELQSHFSAYYYKIPHTFPIFYRTQIPFAVLVLLSGEIILSSSRGKKILLGPRTMIGLHHLSKGLPLAWDCYLKEASEVLLIEKILLKNVKEHLKNFSMIEI